MCMGASSSKSDGGMSEAHKSMHSGVSSSPSSSQPSGSSAKSSSTLMKSSGDGKDLVPVSRSGVVRPGANSSPTRRRNAYNQLKGRRNNPTLLQSILDTSVTYNAAKYIGRRFDPRG